MTQPDDLILWREGEWRCEFNPGIAGAGRLEIYHSDRLTFAEQTLSGPSAIQRAEILRLRVLRDIAPDAAATTPPCPKCAATVRITGGRLPMVYFKCDQCGVVGAYDVKDSLR